VLEMELMSGTDLFDKLSSSGVLRDADAAGLVRNVLRAAAFCARRGMAHRDIKLANLIYPTAHASSSSSSSNSGVSPSDVRLADFGMVGICDAQGLLHGRCGTPGYVAPEILHAAVHEGYPGNVDSFSVGVVAYTVLCGFEVTQAITCAIDIESFIYARKLMLLLTRTCLHTTTHY
jgi:serine/threonine protein kinase